MLSPDPTYPAKRTQSPSGEFIIRQYFLPIRLNGEEIWALLDTGAHISLLPKDVAGNVLTTKNKPIGEGTYSLARLVEVPYKSYNLDFGILPHINDTIPEFKIEPYVDEPRTNAQLRNVEFQVPELTWPEIAERLDADPPVSVRASKLDFIILGLYGVLDQLNVAFTGNNSVSIAPKAPD